ncbi:MAG: phage tail tube protein [Paracoccaceae bacterium]
MARAYGSRAQMALAFESVYGTAPAGGFIKMPFASATLGSEQPLIDNELLGYGRDPLSPTRDAIVVDGDVVGPVDVVGIGHWLKGLFGAPVTTGTTPKVHTFASGAFDLPSMSIELGHPEVPRFELYSGVRANSMRVEATRRGLLQTTIGLVAQGVAPNATTQAGTPSTFALTRFGHFNCAITRNGTSLGNIVSADFTYSNNLDRVETIRADGKIDGADPTIASLGGQIRARFADTTLLDQAIAGGSCELAFTWSLGANASLAVTAHSVFLPVPRRPVQGPGGIEASFDWQAALATSPARMCTVVLTNTVAAY